MLTTFEGTNPGDVFGEELGAQCESFIKAMIAEGLPHSQLLRHRRAQYSWPNRLRGQSRYEFETRGYGIGRVAGRFSFSPGDAGQDVFICEDSRLRVWTSGNKILDLAAEEGVVIVGNCVTLRQPHDYYEGQTHFKEKDLPQILEEHVAGGPVIDRAFTAVG